MVTFFVMPHSIPFSKLIETEWADDVFIEGGILSRGEKFLLGAESKAGKSTLLLDFIRSLSQGKPFLGFKIPKPLKVLYIQAELKEGRLKQRVLPSFGKEVKGMSNAFVWSTKGKIYLPAHYKDVRQEVEEVKPDVTIFDPSISFHRYDENSSQQMTDFFRQLDHIVDDYQVSMGLAQHFRKSTQDSKKYGSLLEMIRGTSAFRGWPDTTIVMEGRTETEYRKLEFETRNSDETIHRYIQYNKDTKLFDWYNPLQIIGEWASKYIQEAELKKVKVNSTMFIKDMLVENGALLSHNKQKAQEMKNALMQTKQISERVEGKFRLIFLPEEN